MSPSRRKPDLNPPPATLPAPADDGPEFRFTSLQNVDREDIVSLSADFNNPGAAYVPVNDLDLSALGANLDVDGQWDSPTSNLVGWRHIASLGRDQYVKIVRRGYLFPLGHRAVSITIVERIFSPDPAGTWSDAVLQLQQFVRVTEPVKTYPAPGQPFDANSWPFTSVQVTSLITPALDSPYPELIANEPQAVRLQVGGVDFAWTVVATDLAGNAVQLRIPQVFMFGYDKTQASLYGNEFDVDVTAPIAAAYNALPMATSPAQLPSAVRTADGGGQPIRYAPEAGGPTGATTHPTVLVSLAAGTPTTDPTTPTAVPSPATESALQSADQPAFYPSLFHARVRLPAADSLSRSAFGDAAGPGVGIRYYQPYVPAGLPETGPAPSGNLGTVYAQLVDETGTNPGPTLLTFPGDAVGGIGTPNMGLSGLSAVAGTVAGPIDTYASAGQQLPADYFKSIAGQTGVQFPQLLGGLTLGPPSGAASGVQGILGSFLNDLGMPEVTNQIDPATGARTVTYTLTASLQPWGPDGGQNDPNPVFVPQTPDPTMTLNGVSTITPGQPPTYQVKGTLTPFNILIIGATGGLNFIIIPFNRVTFTSSSGAKPDVKVDIGQVQFQGALSFLNGLEQFLEDLGGSGFKVTTTPTEIDAGFSIGLPSTDIGMVSLDNLGLSAKVSVPFLGSPALATFSFASQEHKFLVSVSMFGGGGYVTLVLGLSSVQQVSAEIDFCGNFSLDVGIASGGLSLTAGLSYLYQHGQGVTLTGFVKMQGGLEVLGIISISAELDLSLTYFTDGTNNYVAGTASMSCSVHVIFFTITVGFSVHKQFAGSSNPSTPSVVRGHGGGLDPMIVAVPEEGARRRERTPVGAGARRAHPDDNPLPPPNGVTPATFTDLIPDQPTWNLYCASFAA